jgi:hypothetical protein
MQIKGLSPSGGHPPISVFSEESPAEARFGYIADPIPELDALWESGEIDKIMFKPPPPYPAEVNEEIFTQEPPQNESFHQVVGRNVSKYDYYHKQRQPTIFGPTTLYSNVLELRGRFTR